MEVFGDGMSEFKFACPVCGQHITADSVASGSQLECPTCFRKIVVPQAPSTRESKFILAASEANKSRPRTSTPALESVSKPVREKKVPAAIIGLIALLVIGASGATFYAFSGKLFGKGQTAKDGTPQTEPGEESAANENNKTAKVPAPTNNVAWSLDLAGATFPDAPPAGKIRGEYVSCNRSTFSGSDLGFRQTRRGMPDLGVTIRFFTKQPEELRGKKISIETNDSRVPTVIVRWKEGKDAKSQTFKSGYALKLELGEIADNHIPGKVYLSLPDENQTRVAGSFSAEIRKPSPPKPRLPSVAANPRN
jgi:hypothetical protein